MLARALDVGVFDAQQHDAAEAARVEEIEDRGTGAADVKEAGGRGGETEFHGRASLNYIA